MRRARPAVLALVAAVAAACAPGGDESGILVDRIDDAVFAVESHYQAPQEYFEISATTERVSVVVAVDDATAADQAFWDPDDGLIEPVPLGPAQGATFRSSDLEFDPGKVLGRIDDELPDSDIADFAIVGGSGGVAIYDATVTSEQGGSLRVLLGPDGAILGVDTILDATDG